MVEAFLPVRMIHDDESSSLCCHVDDGLTIFRRGNKPIRADMQFDGGCNPAPEIMYHRNRVSLPQPESIWYSIR